MTNPVLVRVNLKVGLKIAQDFFGSIISHTAHYFKSQCSTASFLQKYHGKVSLWSNRTISLQCCESKNGGVCALEVRFLTWSNMATFLWTWPQTAWTKYGLICVPEDLLRLNGYMDIFSSLIRRKQKWATEDQSKSTIENSDQIYYWRFVMLAAT